MKWNEKLWLKIMITDNWLATPKSLLKKYIQLIIMTLSYDHWNEMKWTQMK